MEWTRQLEKSQTFSLKCVFSYVAIIICENAIKIHSAVRRDEQPLKINTLFSEKIRN